MAFINNAFEVTLKSLTTWVSQILGYATIFYAYVQSSNPEIQATLHFGAWQNWVPWVIGLGVAFGVPVARSIKQPAVTKAANK